jgi:uncharacterized protein
MHPHISIITLGVDHMPRARMFYEQLGFVAGGPSNEHVTFFQAGPVILSLYGRAALADDAHIAVPAAGPAAVTIAHNVGSDAEVDAVLAQAVAAGATLLKPGQKVFWGGYSGYFADPDGHLWEVAHNPFATLSPTGALTMG